MSAATYRTFLDLKEVRKYEDVSYHFSSELDLLYLKARRKLVSPQKIIVPITSAKPFQFKELEQIQSKFATNAFCIAICDTSSIVQYYKLERS